MKIISYKKIKQNKYEVTLSNNESVLLYDDIILKYELLTKKEIDNEMPLMVSPIPNSVIRVMMDTKPLDKKISLKEQKLTSPVRTGFTVVEWGGTIVE